MEVVPDAVIGRFPETSDQSGKMVLAAGGADNGELERREL